MQLLVCIASEQKELGNNSHDTRNLPSQVLVVVPDCDVLCLLQLPLMLCYERRVNLDFWRLRKLANKLKVSLVGETASKPKERLLEVVVAPGTQVVVLQIAFPVELYVLCLDLPVL